MAAEVGKGPASVITGLIVAVAAAVPLVWMATNGSGVEPTTQQEPETISAAPAPPTTLLSEVVEVVADPVEIEALPDSVVRTLEAAGNVRKERGGELQLPGSVIAVLSDHNIVLRVAEEPAP